MPRRSIAARILPALILLSLHWAGARGGGTDLETISPEEVGWSSERLDEAARHAGRLGFSALMLVHDGRVFFSWGKVEENYKCHSIRKPFLSALYGMYLAEGTIDLDLTMDALGIDDTSPSLTATEKQATIRHLLQGRSGIYHEAAGETQGMKSGRPERGSHWPGTFFYYNNWDFNALGTIFEQLTGKKIFEEFKKRVADPIGMQDFDVSECYYRKQSVSVHPMYNFRMSARDMARFGILYQKGGLLKGQRIIPEDWIPESTTSYSEGDPAVGAGFGYLWGTMAEGSKMAELLGGPGFFFSGAGVHVLSVVPELKLVLVLRMDTDGEWKAPRGATELFRMIRDARTG